MYKEVFLLLLAFLIHHALGEEGDSYNGTLSDAEILRAQAYLNALIGAWP
jgi:hypothetical protein